jgi:hypothetical protein
MISNIFSSNENKKGIIVLIQENIKNTYQKNININSDQNYNYMIDETIKYVLSQVSPKVPKGIKQSDYLNLMNNKVVNTIFPVIKQKIKLDNLIENTSKNISQNISQNNDKNNKNDKNKIKDHENIFDELLIKNYEIPEIIEYPKPSFKDNQSRSADSAEYKIKSLENERSSLIPKIKPVDFTIKNEEKNNTMQMYNELLTSYNPILENNSNLVSDNSTSRLYSEINSELLTQNIIPGIINNNINNDLNQSTPINMLNDYNISSNINLQTNTLIETFKSNNSNPSSNNNLIINNNKNNSKNNIQYNGPNFSSTNNDAAAILFKEPEFEIIEKLFYIIVDSNDRDLYEYPNQTSFQVKFAPTGNNYIYKNIYDKYNTLILKEKTISYGDGNSTFVGETFDNVQSISCKSVNIPLNILYFGLSNPSVNNFNLGFNIFKESFIYLTIPEFRGPYYGGTVTANNAFAKLNINFGYNTNQTGSLTYSNFTNVKTADDYEYYINDPMTLGRMDKMTLNLTNRTGQYCNFGIDKLFIKSIQPGNLVYDSYCGNNYLSTVLTIQNINSEYAKYCSLYSITGNCNILNSHPVLAGDLLSFYNTLPLSDEIIFFENNINILKIKQDKNKPSQSTISVYYNYFNNKTKKNEKVLVDLGTIIPQDNFKEYYFVIFDISDNKYFYLKVFDLSKESIITEYIDQTILNKNVKLGIGKQNLRGKNNDDHYSLFNNNGFRVINVGTTNETKWTIELNYPYENLPNNLKDKTLYKDGQIFFIQDKLQITYTFAINTLIKSYNEVKSRLNESGNN